MSIKPSNFTKAAFFALGFATMPAAGQTLVSSTEPTTAASNFNDDGFLISNIPESMRPRYNTVDVREPNFLDRFSNDQHEITLAGRPAVVALRCMEEKGAVPVMRHAGDYPKVETNARGEVSISINGHLRGEFRHGAKGKDVLWMSHLSGGQRAYEDVLLVDENGAKNVAEPRLTGTVRDRARHARACVEQVFVQYKKAAVPLRPTTVTVGFGKPKVIRVLPTR
jgi:hypothetical protein